MCGICGFIDFKKKSDEVTLENMVASLHHRGPDDRGSEMYTINNSMIGFGQTRLSILDLSMAGHQPMHYEHLSVVLNGEIYNFKEIRSELELLGHKFVSKSDTEVVLHSFSEWGTKCLSKFIGMFAFVILDKKAREITLVRDRAGVKPLFYYWNEGLFLFASELKAFHKHPRFQKIINKDSVHQYMDYGYVPSPYCIFENCAKLDAGHILIFSIDKNKFNIQKYWDVNDYYNLPRLNIPYSEAKDSVEQLMHSAFEYRMVSDVPVGIFLSGGYDSTAVAALLQHNRSEKLNTYTIGFEEGNNEAPFAKEIAKYIGTNHTEYYCTTKEAQEIIPSLSYYYDEPFADSSAIPTTLVSKLAKNDVAVALSADAGDEIFAGYNIYDTFLKNLKQINAVSPYTKKGVSYLTNILQTFVPNSNYDLQRKMEVFSKILKLKDELKGQKLYQSYYTLGSLFQNKLLINPISYQETAFDNIYIDSYENLSTAMAIDYKMYLQNDILTKVDRATMSVSLEGREPFLDHRIIEFTAQLPMKFKIGLTKKRILKDIVHDYIPKQLMDRPKSGFSIPTSSWLKNDLAFLLEDYLNITAITESGIFNPKFVQKIKNDFLNGQFNDYTIIWKILQFQMWYKEWMG